MLASLAAAAALAAAPLVSPGSGFRQHLAEAIVLNTERRAYYAARSGGRSCAISDMLIRTELVLLPLASYLDAVAAPLQAAGSGVIREAFTSMHDVVPAATPPRYHGRASLASVRQLAGELQRYRAEVTRAQQTGDLPRVAHATARMLETITRCEEAQQAHFAMARHVVESLGLAAVQGAGYQGEARELSMNLVGIQALGLGMVATVDRWIQELHAEGIGIVVNDIPAIPFASAYEAWSRASSSSAAIPGGSAP